MNTLYVRFTHSDVLAVAGIASPTLQNWANRGLVELSLPHPGRGKSRYYTLDDVVRICCLARLVEFGLPPAEAKAPASIIAKDAITWLFLIGPGVVSAGLDGIGSELFLWNDGGRWKHTDRPERLDAVPTLRVVPKAIAMDVARKLNFPIQEDESE